MVVCYLCVDLLLVASGGFLPSRFAFFKLSWNIMNSKLKVTRKLKAMNKNEDVIHVFHTGTEQFYRCTKITSVITLNVILVVSTDL